MQRTWAADAFEWDAAVPCEHAAEDCTLFHGDCTWLYENVPDGSVDLLLTDPPYGITRNGWDTPEFRETLNDTWAEWLRVVKPDGAIVVMAASPFDKIMAVSNLPHYRYEWIWNKNKATGHLNAKRLPMKAHENVLVFYREPPVYNRQITLGHAPCHAVHPAATPQPDRPRNYGHHNCSGNPGGATARKPRTVLNIPVHNNDCDEKWHPTQKPVKLMEYFVRTYTKPGETVMDPFMGSGTTAVAALRCGRKFVGAEVVREYFKKAKRRIAKGERKARRAA